MAAALAAVLLGAARTSTPLDYSAPAGLRAAGADALRPTDAILPDGRIAAPVGKSVFVGTNPLGFALSPDGRYAIVSNDDERTGGFAIPSSTAPLVIGYSLAVVDTRSMNVVDVYHDPAATFFMGVAAVRDPSDPTATLVFASDGKHGVVRVFGLNASGQLAPESAIALPTNGPLHAFPAGMSASPDGSTIYVVDNVGNALDAIDVATRKVARTTSVGYFPFSVAAGARRVVVSNGGLSTYAPLASPQPQPVFGSPVFDVARSSSLSIFDLAADTVTDPATVPMDPQPNGLTDIGGAAPGAIVLSRKERVAYVALSGVDRVAVVHLDGAPKVVRGMDLRLYPRAPYGALPSAEALSRDGKRLYVALAGLNAVAVLAAKAPTHYRYGLIPTGWYPSALELGPKGRYLYALDTKGVDGFGMLQRIDLKHLSLVKATLAVLRYNRKPTVGKRNLVVPLLRSKKTSDVIDHVVYIAFGDQGYDEMLGDLTDATGAAHGNGDPTFSVYNERITPNLHALARTYGLADNFYAADTNRAIAQQASLGMESPLYAQRIADVADARAPLNGSDDPEDYSRSGDLFERFVRAGLSARSYGALLNLSGASARGFGYNVPVPTALQGVIDLAYTGTATARAAAFQRDMQPFVASDRVPSFTYISLPASRATMAEADRALGRIVAYISNTPHWSSTAIFIVPNGTDLASDHVNVMRSYALVVSPLARRGFVGKIHLSPAGVVKTEEEIFGLDPLGLADLLATDLSAFFTDVPDPEPYQAIL